MKYIQYAFVAALLFISSSSLALASVTPVDGAPTDPQPFTVTCDPVATPLVEGGSYFLSGNVCTYTLPQTGSIKYIGIYKGVVGNSTPVLVNPYFGHTETTVIDTGYNFSDAVTGDHYFAVAFSSDDFGIITAGDQYIRSGPGSDPDNPLTPPDDMTVVNFVWASPVQPRSPLTVTADNKNIELGSPLPAYTSTLSGFVAPDTASSNDVTGHANCNAPLASGSAVGTYTISCALGSLVSANNYTFDTFVNGTITIVDTTNPVVTITTPADGSVYHKNDTLVVSANISDLSPISNVVYTLNGAPINPANPLPISSNPTATTTYTLVVTATDSSNNTGTATSVFKVAPVPPTAPSDVTPPTIVITSPLKYGIYGKSDTVFLTATVTDQSPITETTYWLNGVKINPAVKLPLSSAPLISKVMVAAKDSYGNRATTTQTFFVVKSTSSCLTDIIAILLALTQDKTLPDKPTLANLIADCSCFSKGIHRFDLH